MAFKAWMFDLVELFGFLLALLDFAGWSVRLEQVLDQYQRRLETKWFDLLMVFENDASNIGIRQISVFVVALGFTVLFIMGAIGLGHGLVHSIPVVFLNPALEWEFTLIVGRALLLVFMLCLISYVALQFIRGVGEVLILLPFGGLGLLMGVLNKAPSGIIGSVGFFVALTSFGAKWLFDP